MRIKPPAKTFAAAAYCFSDSLTEAHRARDVHQFNSMAELCHLAYALESELSALNARLAKIEAVLKRQG
jgi:hypothetical protein